MIIYIKIYLALYNPLRLICHNTQTTNLYQVEAWAAIDRLLIRIESRARGTQPIKGVPDVSDDTACKGVQVLALPGSRKKIRGKKKSLLWVYVSPSVTQTFNKLCAPFENKMRDIEFYKEVCFASFIEDRSLSLCSWLCLWEVYNMWRHRM